MIADDPTAFEALHVQVTGQSPPVILRTALSTFERRISIAFSGAEDVVLIDMACKIMSGVRVFTLDTGRLHPETYRFIERVRDTYPIELDVLTPSPALLEPFVRAKGLFSFYKDGHHECCEIRKVEPLRRYLATVDAWVTGQRRDQNLTRAALPEVDRDAVFSTPGRPLIKINPLANWSSAQVWDYIEAHDVPHNELHRRGFISIGCEPCTRPILPNQPEREGRWWWEDAAKKECGLHPGRGHGMVGLGHHADQQT